MIPPNYSPAVRAEVERLILPNADNMHAVVLDLVAQRDDFKAQRDTYREVIAARESEIGRLRQERDAARAERETLRQVLAHAVNYIDTIDMNTDDQEDEKCNLVEEWRAALTATQEPPKP